MLHFNASILVSLFYWLALSLATSTSYNSHKLLLKDAIQIANIAHQRAAEINVSVTVAICDEGGHLICSLRGDNCFPFASQIAEAKAVGSAMLMKDGGDLLTMSTNRAAFFNQISTFNRLPLIPGIGGLVIRKDGQAIGAIGVSGAAPDQDLDIATYALKAYNDMCMT